MNINSATALSPLTGGSKTESQSQLDMDQFMRLLTVQLATQNPLEPMSDRDFFAQMAQLGTVQGIDKLKESLDVSQAATLMGKTVTAVRPFTDTGAGMNELVSGVVKKLSVRNGEYFLGIEEANGGMVEIRMDNIQSVAITEVKDEVITE
jgi:flagellar basal-body rod modification protein FlgD